MTNYLGDYAAGVTIDFKWTSNGGDGASITRATNGTVSVYKGNSTTQTTTGVTDTEDFDSLTGIHHCRIATSDAFYATGNDYQVVLSGATIDGKTVNAVLAHFSIENRRHTTAAAVADAVWDESMEGHLAIGTTGAVLEDAASFFPEWAEDIADAVWDEALSGHTTAGSAGEALDNAGGGSSLTAATIADAVWDEAAIGHVADGTTGQYLSSAAKGSYLDNSALAASNLRSAFLGGTYNAAGLSIASAASVAGTVAANLVNVGSSATLYAALVALIQAAVPGTVVSGTNTSTVISTGLASTTTGRYVGKTLVVTSGSRAGEGGKLVTAYDGATKRLTVEAMTGALTAGDTFVLVG